jgi:integrase
VHLPNYALAGRITSRRTRNGLVFSEPKTAYSRRRIVLSTTVVRALRQHHARQLKERLALGANWEDLGLVFANEIGRPLEAGNVLQKRDQ